MGVSVEMLTTDVESCPCQGRNFLDTDFAVYTNFHDTFGYTSIKVFF